jgi:hypothetical protein
LTVKGYINVTKVGKYYQEGRKEEDKDNEKGDLTRRQLH